MRPLARIAETTNLVALALWLSVLLGAGASAALLFPTMKGLEPTLASFEAYPHDHWKIAGGLVASRLFLLGDIVQLACVCLTLLALIVSALTGGLPASRGSLALRLLFLCGAWLLASYQIMVLGPRMQTNLNAFYTAAKEGQVEEARAFQAAFDTEHPTSTRVLGGTLLGVFGGLAVSAWSLTGGRKQP